MKFVFVTLFPEMIRSACEWSILGRAAREGLLSVECVDPRDYATDRHRSVDDTTCGGGAGMVLKPQDLSGGFGPGPGTGTGGPGGGHDAGGRIPWAGTGV